MLGKQTASENIESHHKSFIVQNIDSYKPSIYFTGRTELLDESDKSLFKKIQTSILVITGLGGIGKTQLARQYAHNYSSI